MQIRGVMEQERDPKEREENVLALRATDMQVQSDSGLPNAFTAVEAVVSLQCLGYATVQALSAPQSWVQLCPSIPQCFHDSSQDLQDREDGEINELRHLLLLQRDVQLIGPLGLFLAMQPIFKVG